MKITRDRALAVTAYCRAHNLKYVGQGQYPNSVSAGLRAGTKAPNGVHIHFPRDNTDPHGRWQQKRVYVIWQGETLEALSEACAFILMTSKRDQIYIVRCKHASKAAEEVEQTNPDATILTSLEELWCGQS